MIIKLSRVKSNQCFNFEQDFTFLEKETFTTSMMDVEVCLLNFSFRWVWDAMRISDVIKGIKVKIIKTKGIKIKIIKTKGINIKGINIKVIKIKIIKVKIIKIKVKGSWKDRECLGTTK